MTPERPTAEPPRTTPYLVAARIGRSARVYLDRGPSAGRVVSQFRGGVNALLERGSSRALVVLQTDAVAFHPWGVAVDPDLSERVTVGNSVTAAPHRIQLGSGLAIDVAGAAVVDLRIERFTQLEARRARARLPFLSRSVGEADPVPSEIARRLDGWRAGACPEHLVGLVGLGPGATPAGDDLLVGILAGLAASPVGRAHGQGLRRRLDAVNLPQRTPIGSAQAIRAAIGGAFPEPLVDLAAAARRGDDDAATRTLDHLVRLGASSGRAMLVGFRAGLGVAGVRV